LTIESRSQSAETIKKILEDQGYADVAASEQTDTAAPPKAAEEAARPVEDKPGEKTPDPDLGDDVAGEGEDEPPVAEAAPATPPKVEGAAEPRKKGGFARKLERQAVELDSLKATIADMNRKLADKPAAQPAKPAEAAAPKPAEVEDAEPVMGADEEWEPFNARLTRWLVRDERRQAAKVETERIASEASARKTEADETVRLAAETERQATEERWKASRERIKAVHPDSEEVFARIMDPKTPHGTVAMGLVARDYEEVADLIYYLGTHPEEEARIMAKTQLPDNFAQLGPRAQQRAIRTVEDAAREEFDTILSALPAAPSPEVIAPGTAPRRETPVAAAPIVVPPAAAPPARVPAPKMAPPSTVGHRGGSPTKRYPQDFSTEELRALPIDEVRRLKAAQA